MHRFLSKKANFRGARIFPRICGCVKCDISVLPTSQIVLRLETNFKNHYCCLSDKGIAFYVVYPTKAFKLSSGRMDRASATEAVDLGSIPGRVKPNTIKINIHSFPA